MGITEKTWLPTYEELTVEEIPLGVAALRAGAFHLGKYCESANNEYMLCRSELKDPRKCVNEGKEVTKCSLEFFRSVKKLCFNEFERYAFCIDKSGSDFDYMPCRKTQNALDKCLLDNMGIERPDYDYYCLPKIYESQRSKPEKPPLMVFEGTPPGPLDADAPPPKPAKYGARGMFLP